MKQREDMSLFGDCLRAFMRGDDTSEAEAASIAIARLLEVARGKLGIR